MAWRSFNLWSFVLVLTFVAFVSATTSGIFDERGHVTPSPLTDGSAFSTLSRRKAYVGKTNAERLRLGEPLIPPNLKRDHAATNPSGTPCAPLQNNIGYLAVYADDGKKLGYVRNTFNKQSMYSLALTPDSRATALQVVISSNTPFSAPFEIAALNGPDGDHVLLGFVAGKMGYYFTKGALGYAYLSGTGHLNAGLPPTDIGNSIQVVGYNAPAESTVWSLSCSLEFSTTWTNIDQTCSEGILFYDTSIDYLGITGDLTTITQTFPSEGIKRVTLVYEPLV